MAINKKLIHFDKFDNFNSLKLSANKENTMYTIGLEGSQTAGSPDILYQSIVFIKDTKLVWTHGSIYYSSAEGIEDLLKSKVSSSSTSQDNQIPVFDGTTGRIIKVPASDSMVTLDASLLIEKNLDISGNVDIYTNLIVEGNIMTEQLQCDGDVTLNGPSTIQYDYDNDCNDYSIANTTFVLQAINHKLTGIQESIDEIEEKIDNNIKVYVINLVGGVVLNSSSDLSSMYDDISADVEHSLIRISSKASSSAISPLMYDCGNISYYEPAINAGAINISVTGQITSYNVMLLRGSCTVTTKTWTLS